MCGDELQLRLSSTSLSHSVAQGGGAHVLYEGAVAQEHSARGQPLSYLLTVSGSYQMQLFMGSAAKGATVHVRPGRACAAATVVSGGALSVGTAGFGATFTIQSRDSFGNARSGSDDAFRVLLRHQLSDERHDSRAVPMAQAPATNLGRYAVAYRTTRAGAFALDVRLVTAGRGGLNATCFSPALDKAAQGGWVMRALDANDAAHAGSAGSDNAFLSASCRGMPARWEGSLSARFTETYTFAASLGATTERVRLWVEDRWVIDQWSSLASLSPSGTLWMAKDVLTDFGLVYRAASWSGSSAAAPQLRWTSSSQPTTLVNTDRLFAVGAPVSGSPFAVTVFPARMCGAVTTAVGVGLSLATAGSGATFTIVAKDHLGNERGAAPHHVPTDGVEGQFAVFVRRNRDHTVRDSGGTVTDLGHGLYKASYTPFWKRNVLTWQHSDSASGGAGLFPDSSPSAVEANFPVAPRHHVSVVLAEQGGVQATYYNQPNFTQPSRASITTKVQMAVSASSPLASGCVSNAEGFSARFRGMLRPPGSQRYTFSAALAGPQVCTQFGHLCQRYSVFFAAFSTVQCDTSRMYTVPGVVSC